MSPSCGQETLAMDLAHLCERLTSFGVRRIRSTGEEGNIHHFGQLDGPAFYTISAGPEEQIHPRVICSLVTRFGISPENWSSL